MDATSWAALFAAITAIVQVVANQWGADRARKHELDLKKMEADEDDESSGDGDGDRGTDKGTD